MRSLNIKEQIVNKKMVGILKKAVAIFFKSGTNIDALNYFEIFLLLFRTKKVVSLRLLKARRYIPVSISIQFL